jgi:cell filamentation protein
MGTDRYQASGMQAEHQPGSQGRVLRNRLGITDPDEIDEVELTLLLQLYDLVLGQQFPSGQLQLTNLKEWHRLRLGNLYDWAGEERPAVAATGRCDGGTGWNGSAGLQRMGFRQR